MSEQNAAVAIYNAHADAEAAVRELHDAGFPIEQLSIVGREYHTEEQVVGLGYYNKGERMRYWGQLGDFWGSIWRLLQGAGFFAVPGIGPVLVAGPLIGWMLGAL